LRRRLPRRRAERHREPLPVASSPWHYLQYPIYKSCPFCIPDDYNCSSRSASRSPPLQDGIEQEAMNQVGRWRWDGSCQTSSLPTSCAASRRAAWLFPVASAGCGVISSMPGECCVRICSRALWVAFSATTGRSIHRSSWLAPRWDPPSPATLSSSLGSLSHGLLQRPHALHKP